MTTAVHVQEVQDLMIFRVKNVQDLHDLKMLGSQDLRDLQDLTCLGSHDLPSSGGVATTIVNLQDLHCRNILGSHANRFWTRLHSSQNPILTQRALLFSGTGRPRKCWMGPVNARSEVSGQSSPLHALGAVAFYAGHVAGVAGV